MQRDDRERVDVEHELVCDACGWHGHDGFRAAWGFDDDEWPEPELVVFCAVCWSVESVGQ